MFRRLIDGLTGAGCVVDPKRGRLMLESLENRQMMAGDVDLFSTNSAAGETPTATSMEDSNGLVGQPEGEPEQDLVAFARALAAAGVQFFSAAWCPFCTEQKQLFQDGQRLLPEIEVTGPDRQLNSIGIAEGIQTFPTWEFPDGSRLTGVQSLATLSQRSGVAIPTSEQPTFAAIGAQTVRTGSPLHIPIDAYDPNGGPLTVTVSVDNPALLDAVVLSGNRSIRIDMQGYGDMVFELFEDRAPVPSGRVIELANSNFYDGIIFHRVVDGFVIQAGDPTGTGTSGSPLGNFDDQFHADLQHNRSGVLSFAKTTDDTNNSQFFITETPTRNLDFNHSIFGQLVEGEAVREAISGTAANAQGRPNTNVTISSIDVFDDIENSVVMLRARGNATGTTNVRFTVTDAEGNTFSEVVPVTVAADNANSQPFLNPITTPAVTAINTPATLQLSSIDVEGDAVSYFAQSLTSPTGVGTVTVDNSNATRQQATATTSALVGGLLTINGVSSTSPIEVRLERSDATSSFFAELTAATRASGTVTVDATTGVVRVTPNAGFSGTLNVVLGARRPVANSTTQFTNTYFLVSSITNPGIGTVAVNTSTGAVTTTPANNFAGTINAGVGTRFGGAVTGNAESDNDLQTVAFRFEGEQTTATTPTGVDLIATSDTGTSSTDNITNAGSLTFTVSGVTSGATVELVLSSTGVVVGTALASGTTVNVTTNNIAALGDGTYSIAARQRVGTQTSSLSTALSLVYDATTPASVIGSAVTVANVNRAYTSDLISTEEGNGLRYALTAFPAGASINATTGVITWTPTSAQSGANTFTLTLTDVAGNVRTESFTVNTTGIPLAEIRLRITDLSGNEINNVNIGDTFLLEMIGTDARGGFNARGVFAAAADILFDSTLVQPVAGSTIQYAPGFSTQRGGVFATGLIDELGAARTDTTPTNEVDSLVATVRLTALAAGNVNFRSEPAENANSEVLLYLVDNQIPAGSIAYGNVSLAIGQNFRLNPDTLTVLEDASATTVNVLTNDTVTGTGTLSVTAVSQPVTGGTVTLANGQVRFTPAANFNGTTTFSYTAAITGGATQTASVTVTVTAVNDPPTGAADTFTVSQDSAATDLDVLVNDSVLPDAGETLRITAVSASSAGSTLSVNAAGNRISYRPRTGFSGTDTFTYTLSDGTLTTSVQATVTVGSADAPPTAVNDTNTVVEDAAQASFNVTANDTRDAANQSFVISTVGVPSQGGTASIGTDGSQLLYQPRANFNGTETVTYTIRDTGGGTATATATFTVTAVNDQPPVSSPTRNVNRTAGETVIFNVSNLPANVDANETLTFTVLGTRTSGGAARISTDGTQIFYTPPSSTFTGTDTFTFTVRDSSNTTSSGTITVQVNDFSPVNVALDLGPSASILSTANFMLVGTDVLGASVSRPVTNTAGGAIFQDVLPGNYNVNVPAIPFLQNGDQARTLPITVAANSNASNLTVSPNLGALRARFVSMTDWFGSAPRQAVIAAVAPGQSQTFAALATGTTTITSPSLQLNADGTSLTITGRNSAGADVTATVPAVNDRRVETRANVDSMRLVRVSLETADITFTPVTTSSSGGGSTSSVSSIVPSTSTSSTNLLSGGEGELIAASSPLTQPLGVSSVAAASSSSVLIGDQLSAGRSPSSASVSRSDVFVPEVATVRPVRRNLASSKPADTSSVIDTAMNDLLPSIRQYSMSGDAIAEASSTKSSLNENSIDEVLTSQI